MSPRKNAPGWATPSSAPPREGIGTEDVEAGISRLSGGVSRLPTGRFRRVRIVTTEMICIIGASRIIVTTGTGSVSRNRRQSSGGQVITAKTVLRTGFQAQWEVLRNPFNAKFVLFKTLNNGRQARATCPPERQQPGGLFPVVRAVQWIRRGESAAYFLASLAAGTFTVSSLLAPALTVTLYSRFR